MSSDFVFKDATGAEKLDRQSEIMPSNEGQGRRKFIF